MIRLRDLLGVGTLEWAIAQDGWTEENEEWAAGLSESLFGIAIEDTYPCVDEDGSCWLGGVEVPDAEEFRRRSEAWEPNFDVLRYFRDESDAYWASVGWDVTDGQGKQLEVMRRLGRSLVCVVNRLHADAALNIDSEQDAKAWGAKLEEEAKRFKPAR